MRRSWLLLPLLICLSGCPPENPKPESGKTLKDVLNDPPKGDAATIEKNAVKHAKDGPLRFRTRTVNQMQESATLSRYVCGAIETHLQDRFLLRKDKTTEYSNEFMLATLKEEPDSLVNTYGTCYVEKELRTLGFERYFREDGGFLAAEAVKGFEAMGAEAHLKLLKRALELGYQKPTDAKAEARISTMLAGLDKLWKELERKPMLKQRATYMRARIDAADWKAE